MTGIEYFLSCIAAFPVSEAIIESWGSVIDKVISDETAFKESEDTDIADITEKLFSLNKKVYQLVPVIIVDF